MASSAFAANNATIHVPGAVNVSGKQLEAGSYKVSWDGTGPAIELSILKGKNVVAKVPAKLVDVQKASATDAVITRSSGNDRELSQIQFGGKKYVIDLGEQITQAENTASMK